MMFGEGRVRASALRRALEYELISTSEVVRWADEQIARLQAPPHALIELALCENESCKALEQLDLLESGVDPIAAWRDFKSLLTRLVEREPQRDLEIARVLFQLASSGDHPAPSSEGEMFRLFDAIEIARDSDPAAAEAARRRLLEFLAILEGAESD